MEELSTKNNVDELTELCRNYINGDKSEIRKAIKNVGSSCPFEVPCMFFFNLSLFVLCLHVFIGFHSPGPWTIDNKQQSLHYGAFSKCRVLIQLKGHEEGNLSRS